MTFPATKTQEMATKNKRPFRVRYLDIDDCPNVVLTEMEIVGVAMLATFGLVWLVQRLFVGIGLATLGAILKWLGFAAVVFLGIGAMACAKERIMTVSYGAFFLDSALVALFFWLVRGEFLTFWMVVAIVGVALHFALKIWWVKKAWNRYILGETSMSCEREE